MIVWLSVTCWHVFIIIIIIIIIIIMTMDKNNE
jgi:hypothetical protein